MGIEKILTQVQGKMTDIESNVAMIKHHTKKSTVLTLQTTHTSESLKGSWTSSAETR